MKNALIVVGGVVVLLGLLAVGGAFYVVGETQQAVIFQFGEPRGDPITTPGLKLKLPFIRKVTYFDNRFLEWDGDPNEVPTRDKRFIHVDTYARWRITDPLKYFQRLRNEQGAQSRLDDILDGETRNTIAKHNLIEVVRSSNREFALAEDLQDERFSEAGRRVMLLLIDKAKGHLDDALEYAATLPRAEYGIRLFCLTSLYFAVRTLRLAERDRRLLDPHHKVKITRGQVYRTIAATRLVAPSNLLVRAYFRRLAGAGWDERYAEAPD